jgi:Protein of unknown function (DUF3102)
MPAPVDLTDSSGSAALVARINAAHDQAHQSARTAIEYAAECGRLLIEAKTKVGHGGWLPWIEANLSFGARQAQRYIRLAAFIEQHPNATAKSHLTIDGVLAAISEPAQKPGRARPKPKWEPANATPEKDDPRNRLITAVRDLNVTWAPAAIESTVAVLTDQQRVDLQQHLPDVLDKLHRLAEPTNGSACDRPLEDLKRRYDVLPAWDQNKFARWVLEHQLRQTDLTPKQKSRLADVLRMLTAEGAP